jgi:osmotically-inducible protein OsmY
MSLFASLHIGHGHDEDKDRRGALPDRGIKGLLVADLQEDRRTRQERIRVDVAQGVVVLGGTIASLEARAVAEGAAWRLPGVADVSNQLRVAGPPASGAARTAPPSRAGERRTTA